MPRFQQVPLSQPLGSAPTPPNCEARCAAGECPLHTPSQGTLRGQAVGASCLGRTGQQHGRTPGLQFVLLSWILFLSLVSFSLWLFALHQQFGEPVVSGEERGGKGTPDAVLVPSRALGPPSRPPQACVASTDTCPWPTLRPSACVRQPHVILSRPLGPPSSYHPSGNRHGLLPSKSEPTFLYSLH